MNRETWLFTILVVPFLLVCSHVTLCSRLEYTSQLKVTSPPCVPVPSRGSSRKEKSVCKEGMF